MVHNYGKSGRNDRTTDSTVKDEYIGDEEIELAILPVLLTKLAACDDVIHVIFPEVYNNTFRTKEKHAALSGTMEVLDILLNR